MHQVDRADDVGVDHAPRLVEILVEKAVTEAAPGIGDQDFDRTPELARGIVELVDTLRGGEISLDGSNLRPFASSVPAASWISGSSAAMIRSYPWSTASLASSRPMPLEAPVTMARGREVSAM